MALERYDYPTAAAPTVSFAPTRNPSFSGVDETDDDGILTEQSSGRQEYDYEEAINVRTHRRDIDRETSAKRTEFKTFKDTVGAKKFEFTDWAGAIHTVRLDRRDLISYKPSAGDRWSWTITLREEL